jgi:hypothetical protein
MATVDAISCPKETPRTPARVDEVLEKALGADQMCAAFGISYATFRRREKKGEFKKFQLARGGVGHKRWSGSLVQRFLDGERI